MLIHRSTGWTFKICSIDCEIVAPPTSGFRVVVFLVGGVYTTSIESGIKLESLLIAINNTSRCQHGGSYSLRQAHRKIKGLIIQFLVYFPNYALLTCLGTWIRLMTSAPDCRSRRRYFEAWAMSFTPFCLSFGSDSIAVCTFHGNMSCPSHTLRPNTLLVARVDQVLDQKVDTCESCP